MSIMYWSNKISEGKPWYPGATRFWVHFSSDVNREFANYKHYQNYTIFLYRRCYTFEDNEFMEYEIEYHVNSQTGTVQVSRDDIKRTLQYKKDFEDLICD